MGLVRKSVSHWYILRAALRIFLILCTKAEPDLKNSYLQGNVQKKLLGTFEFFLVFSL